MALLHMLVQRPKLTLVVAHFDHGIRPDSGQDRRLVQKVARQYGLPYITAQGHLGPEASEAQARGARYAFLRAAVQDQGARAIITAHHQDDMLETAILNLLRGTGRRGLSSLESTREIQRPLLGMAKQDIIAYAQKHQLQWREDSTNADDRYLRNYVRHHIMSRFSAQDKAAFLQRIQHARTTNPQIDALLAQDLSNQPAPDQLSRSWYIALPHAVAREVMAALLRRNGVMSFDRALIDQLVVAAKTKRAGKVADINASHVLKFSKQHVQILRRA